MVRTVWAIGLSVALDSLMHKTTPVEPQNTVGAIAAGVVAPVEMIARKPAMSGQLPDRRPPARVSARRLGKF